MVGMMDLGEVAWEIERLMNGWLEQKRPASAGLLDLISKATAAFAVWVGQLRENSLQGEVDGAALVAMVKKLKEGPGDAAPAPAPAAPAAAAPAPAAPVLELDLDLDLPVAHGGDAAPEPALDLTVTLADIYHGEAAQHVAALQSEFAAWRAAPGAASHEFMRAAHTLASSSQTAGFGDIGELADALEE